MPHPHAVDAGAEKEGSSFVHLTLQGLFIA